MALSFKEALQRLENRRVKATRPLIPPQILQEDLPLCVLFFFFLMMVF
jgi:3-deoxy-7-phosphoheptulonate synthase